MHLVFGALPLLDALNCISCLSMVPELAESPLKIWREITGRGGPRVCVTGTVRDPQ
ncbi:hypothetical protein JOD47_000390 [Arthrobacter tumbae]|nr:hypothetical protein [Arthrobacter tumbae]